MNCDDVVPLTRQTPPCSGDAWIVTGGHRNRRRGHGQHGNGDKAEGLAGLGGEGAQAGVKASHQAASPFWIMQRVERQPRGP